MGHGDAILKLVEKPSARETRGCINTLSLVILCMRFSAAEKYEIDNKENKHSMIRVYVPQFGPNLLHQQLPTLPGTVVKAV